MINDTDAISDVGSSDYAYTMKQWLLSAKTVFEEVATDDPLETEILKLEFDAEPTIDSKAVYNEDGSANNQWSGQP